MVTSSISLVKALEQALISSESSVKSVKRGYEVGVRTALDILNVQQQHFQVKSNLAESRYHFILSHLKLKAIAGELSENDLEAIDNYLTNSAQ